MGVWETYEARLGINQGTTNDLRRDNALNTVQDRMRRKITSSLSYQNVKVNGETVQVAILDTTEFNVKKIFSMPGQELPHGAVIEWADYNWLVTQTDARSEYVNEGRIQQCNYKLKWINKDGIIVSRWCIVEDGTKYLIGEKANQLMTIGDARIAVTIGKDSETNYLKRGMRFLIDDLDSEEVLAYEITKPNKLFNVYGGKGVFRFILNESNVTPYDNIEARVADYYNWEPETERAKPDAKVDATFEKIAENAKEEQETLPEKIKESGVWL